MRLCALLVTSATMASAGLVQPVAPIPLDVHELVTGIGSATADAADRAQAIAMLNRAKRPMRLLAPTTPPYLLTVSFTATGDAANSGVGALSQLWLSGQQSRWTASLGNFTLSRVRIGGQAYDEKPPSLIPMRLHMLRNTIFWAAGSVPAGAKFRTAHVEWNSAPATCLLMSEGPDGEATPARQWNEEEFCIDDRSGLLQILSFAPGSYSIYSYAKGQSFNGQPMPDRITTYIAGTTAIDSTLSMDSPDSGSVPQAPTSAMIANGAPTGLQDPTLMRLNMPNAKVVGATEPVIVNAQVGPNGKVIAQELCAAADASLAPAAIDAVKGMSFGPSDSQRQYYVEVAFTPVSTFSAARAEAPATARVQLEPYYLERTAEDPAGKAGEVEYLARRSDGATMSMRTVGPKELKKLVRDVHFPDGKWVTVYEDIGAKVTWSLPGETEMRFLRERRTDGPADCAAASSGALLRHEQMEGQDVDVIQSTASEYRITRWAAPKLGCEALHVKSETQQANGAFRTAIETRTTRLTPGEPEARWFEIPSGLVEMKPSEAQRKLWESMDLPMSPEEKAAMMRQMERQFAVADSRYQGSK